MTTLLPQPRRIAMTGRAVAAADVVEHRDAALPEQGYRLAISEGAVELTAADDAGAFYGRATLAQLANGANPGALPEGRIEDWPDIAVRGVMLDVSRDKVPTVETLEALIDRLAGLKINHVELYMEHTFAYEHHKAVWAEASAYTAEDILRLDAFCRERHVELTPHQNCLGHFERWLRHDRYRPLAIAPDGWTDGRGRHRAPTTMEPGQQGTIDLVRTLLAELIPNFTSRRMHVGLDEPWELPDERFDDYLDFVCRLRESSELADRQMLIWGDIVASHPDRLGDLPDRVTVCEWGYEADHPFAERAALLAAARRPFWLCPGTSSWNSIVGRTSNMLGNCSGAAEAAIEHGAEGYLITDWGDNGHLQYLPVSEPGFAYGAAVAWCHETNREIDLAAALSEHVFDDPTGDLAGALLALGDAHTLVMPQVPNMSILALHLFSPRFRMGEGITAGLTDADLTKVADTVSAARDAIARARSGRPDAALITAELDTAARLVDLLARDARARLAAGGRLEDVPRAARAAFADEIDQLEAEHREHWLARNRPGGLDDSCRRLETYAAAHRTV